MSDLAFFDFDKTLVAGDSFRLFGDLGAKSAWQRARLLWWALAHKAGYLSNGTYKAHVLREIWAPRGEQVRAAHMKAFHAILHEREQGTVVEALHAHQERGDAVVVVSASPAFYLQPFVRRAWAGDVVVYGSTVHHANPQQGKSTEERLTVEALYGERKRSLARRLIRERAPKQVWAYTDHISDLPLLELADHRRLVNPDAALCRALASRALSFEIVHVDA